MTTPTTQPAPAPEVSALFDREVAAMPAALRILAEQINAPDYVPAMCLRDAAALIESLDLKRSAAERDLAAARAANEELLRDKERLDWLDEGPDFRLAELRSWLHEKYKVEPHAGKLRQAIEAARTAAVPADRATGKRE